MYNISEIPFTDAPEILYVEVLVEVRSGTSLDGPLKSLLDFLPEIISGNLFRSSFENIYKISPDVPSEVPKKLN